MIRIHSARRASQATNYYFADKLAEIRRRIAEGRDVINLGVGSPDLPPAPHLKETIGEDMQRPGAYGYQPYSGIPELKEGFSAYCKAQFGLDLQSDGIVPLLGSKEGCGFLALAHLDPGDTALVPNPGYPSYSSVTALAGGRALPFSLREAQGFLPDLGELETLRSRSEAEDSPVRMMWLNYPNMPTGAAPNALRMQEVMAWAAVHGILVVHDNPYARILNPGRPFSALTLQGSEAVCIELHSLSKSHRMAGARMGFAAGHPELLKPMFKMSTQFSSGSWRPLQRGAIAALESGEADLDQANGVYSERRIRGRQLFDALNCDCREDQVGMFLWARAPEGWDGNRLSDDLLERCDVFLTPGSVFGSEGLSYLRLSLCSPVSRIQEACERITAHPPTLP
jgi:aspartate/methionine/tyrosine aminotransferase